MRWIPIVLVAVCLSAEAQIRTTGEYGVAKTLEFPLWDEAGEPATSATDSHDGMGAGDIVVDVGCTGSGSVSTNAFTEVGGGLYSVDLESGEMEGARICILIDAETGGNAVIETYGSGDAEHANIGVDWLAEVIESDPEITLRQALCLWNAILLGQTAWGEGNASSAWHSPGGNREDLAEFTYSGNDRTSATLTLPCAPVGD